MLQMAWGNYILVVYFGVAVFQAFLSAANVKLIVKNEALKAATVTFVTNFISFTVLYSILTRINSERGILAIVVYCLGLSAGIFIAAKMKYGTDR